MKKALLLSFFLFALPCVSAMADIMPNPYVVQNAKRCSGTIATGGTSQTLLTAAQNAATKWIFIQNPSTASEVLVVDFGQAASTTLSPQIAAGSTFTFGGQSIWNGQITINAATSSHAFICLYGQ